MTAARPDPPQVGPSRPTTSAGRRPSVAPTRQPAPRPSAQNGEYRAARGEYARIRELRKANPVAAHLRERRFELGLTQEYVANAVGTAHTNISRMERGTFMPKLPTLRKIAAVLGEELVVCFQRTVDGEIEREFANVPTGS